MSAFNYIGAGVGGVVATAPEGDSSNKIANTEFVSRAVAKGAFNHTIQSSNYTANANDFIMAETSGGSFIVTLPSTPSDYSIIKFLDYTSSFDVNKLTIARNGNTIMGLAEDMLVDIKNVCFDLIFHNGDWRIA